MDCSIPHRTKPDHQNQHNPFPTTTVSSQTAFHRQPPANIGDNANDGREPLVLADGDHHDVWLPAAVLLRDGLVGTVLHHEGRRRTGGILGTEAQVGHPMNRAYMNS